MARRNVLIVEDNDDQRQALAINTNKWGYHTETASNGQEAIDKLTTSAVHAVVTDLPLPCVNGIALLRWMNKRGKTPPTIVRTAYHQLDNALTRLNPILPF